MINPFQSLLALHPDSPLFADLDPAACVRLRELSTMRHCEAGEVLVTEGAVDPYLYIIRRGHVRIVKNTSRGEGMHTLSVLGAGETIGEMKLAAPGAASATVVAMDPVDVVCVDIKRLRTEPDDHGLREALLSNIACILSTRLRGTSAKTVDAMEAEIQQGRLRESAGRFIVYLFTIMSAFAFVLAGLNALGPHRPPQMLLSAFMIFGTAVPVAVLLRRSPYAAAAYGLTLHRGGRVVRDAVLYTLPVLGILTLVKVAWIASDPGHSGTSLFQPAAILQGHVSLGSWLAAVTAYSVLSALQEFFVRSGLQGSMRLFDARTDITINWRVIVITNLMFASGHAYLGLRFMLAAFIPGLFWGWLFERQRSLLGVAVSHAMVGIWALFVLGLQVIVGGE